jgi:hypothetical protein
MSTPPIPSPRAPIVREALVRLSIARLYSAASALSRIDHAPRKLKRSFDKEPFDKQVSEAKDLMAQALEAIEQAETMYDASDLVLVDSDNVELTIGSTVPCRGYSYEIIDIKLKPSRTIVMQNGARNVTFQATAAEIGAKWAERSKVQV